MSGLNAHIYVHLSLIICAYDYFFVISVFIRKYIIFCIKLILNTYKARLDKKMDSVWIETIILVLIRQY